MMCSLLALSPDGLAEGPLRKNWTDSKFNHSDTYWDDLLLSDPYAS